MAKRNLCAASELPVGEMRTFKVGDTKIVVYHLDDGFYATQSSCTHVFAPLGRGKIVEDCQIQCPFHRARFDIRSGEVVEWANFPPGVQLFNALRSAKALKTYPVKVSKGQIVVDVP